MATFKKSVRKGFRPVSQAQMANQWRFSIKGRTEGCIAQLKSITHSLGGNLDQQLDALKDLLLGQIELQYQARKGSDVNGRVPMEDKK